MKTYKILNNLTEEYLSVMFIDGKYPQQIKSPGTDMSEIELDNYINSFHVLSFQLSHSALYPVKSFVEKKETF